MEKVGLFHFVAEPYLMDFRGRVTLPMIGNYLIHAASSHAGERGFGFNGMSERHTAWENLWIRPFYLGGYRRGDPPSYLIGYRGIGQIYRRASVPDREAGQDHAGGE